MTQSQRGFTIIEVMLAVIVFSVGLLALASSAGVIMSSLTSTQLRTVATSVAEARIERLAATPCGSRTSGSAVTRGISETWRRDSMARADDVTVTVTFFSSHRPRTEQFKTYLPC